MGSDNLGYGMISMMVDPLWENATDFSNDLLTELQYKEKRHQIIELLFNNSTKDEIIELKNELSQNSTDIQAELSALSEHSPMPKILGKECESSSYHKRIRNYVALKLCKNVKIEQVAAIIAPYKLQ